MPSKYHNSNSSCTQKCHYSMAECYRLAATNCKSSSSLKVTCYLHTGIQGSACEHVLGVCICPISTVSLLLTVSKW